MTRRTGVCDECSHVFHTGVCLHLTSEVAPSGHVLREGLCTCDVRGLSPETMEQEPFIDTFRRHEIGDTMLMPVLWELCRRIGKLERRLDP